MKKIAKLIIALCCAVVLAVGGLAGEASADNSYLTVNFQGTYKQTDCRKMADAVNAFRTGSEAWYWNEANSAKVYCNGLSALTYDYTLERIAMQRCAEIALSYSHTRPNGGEFNSAYNEKSYSYGWSGENIAVGYTTAESVQDTWREDNVGYSGQGHRRNMLNSNFNRIGIAGVTVNGTTYWVQEFASSSSANTYTSPNDSLTDLSVSIIASNLKLSASTRYKSCFVVVGESIELPIKATYARGSSYFGNYGVVVTNPVTWVVGNSSIASVSGGMLCGKAAGETTLTASVLGQELSFPVTCHAHSYTSEVTTKATCRSTGVRTYTCSCGDSYTKTIAKASSNHDGGTELRNTRDATCAVTGYTGDTYCLGCGAKLSSGSSIAKLTTHIWDSGVVTREPTTEEEGIRTYTCSVCSATKCEWISRLPLPEWVKETNGKWRYRHSDGSYTLNDWEKIDGKWYLFDQNGYMLIGWQSRGGKWYYMNASGAMMTGWQRIGGSWYYLNSSGAMQTGWLKSGGKWYYLSNSGAMQTGWVPDCGKWYYMDSSGAMQTGWIQSGGKWYYLYSDGHMAVNVWVGNYYVDGNGVWVRSR